LYGYIRCKLGHNPGMSDATGILQQGISSFVFTRATQPAAEETPNAFKSTPVQSV